MTTSFWTSLEALIHKVIYCREEPLLYCIHCIIASCIIHVLLNWSFGLLKKQSFLSNVMFAKCNNGTVAKLANTVFKHDIGENNVWSISQDETLSTEIQSFFHLNIPHVLSLSRKLTCHSIVSAHSRGRRWSHKINICEFTS